MTKNKPHFGASIIRQHHILLVLLL